MLHRHDGQAKGANVPEDLQDAVQEAVVIPGVVREPVLHDDGCGRPATPAAAPAGNAVSEKRAKAAPDPVPPLQRPTLPRARAGAGGVRDWYGGGYGGRMRSLAGAV